MFTLEQVVPWGRSFGEYRAMFSLTEEDLGHRILGCGDGPASFNAEASQKGIDVCSVDPVYAFDAQSIRNRIDETFDVVMEQTRNNFEEFIWKNIPDVQTLGQVRMSAMEIFLGDYPYGLAEGRYLEAELPELPFGDREFGLALCSHFLFLYSEHLDLDFHLDSLMELCRVAGEVRVFPLFELGAKPSRHFFTVSENMRNKGYIVETVRVEYEFQRGGNQMLRLMKG